MIWLSVLFGGFFDRPRRRRNKKYSKKRSKHLYRLLQQKIGNWRVPGRRFRRRKHLQPALICFPARNQRGFAEQWLLQLLREQRDPRRAVRFRRKAGHLSRPVWLLRIVLQSPPISFYWRTSRDLLLFIWSIFIKAAIEQEKNYFSNDFYFYKLTSKKNF